MKNAKEAKMSKMKWLALSMAALTGVVVADAPPSAPPLSGKLGEPVKLFNGKNVEGWVWVQRAPKTGTTQPAPMKIEDVFTVVDGVLHDKGKPTGYIRTEKEYDNYVLTVEQRHVAKGNGGVLFAISGPDKVWPHGLEVQSGTGEEGDIRNVADFKMNVDKSRLDPAEAPKRLKRAVDAEKPPGEWETYEVTADHGTLTVKINGQVVNSATEVEGLKGKIGIQAEGGEIEYRKIELRPIE